jgi:adenosylmethionine-8-amino-7-oxononanoate aminotransferase
MLGSESYVFHRRLDYDYPIITNGDGIYLFNKDGKKYIDACGGAVVNCIGHGNKEIAEKIAEYVSKLGYLHGAQFTTEHMEEFAQKLVSIAPEGINKVYFVSGGSEATETAVKLAIQYQQEIGFKNKNKIIYRWPGYHGSTFTALSLTGKETFRKPFLPLLTDFPHVPAPVCYRCYYELKYPECNLKCAKAVEEKIFEMGPENIAAFIAEPVIGASVGVSIPPYEYLGMVRDICNKYDVLLIFDEVMCGYGRTGKWFASDHWNCSPDIVTIGKGISNGLVPLAAVMCSDKIFDAIKRGIGNFIHGFTFCNNSFSTFVGNLVFDYISDNNLLQNINEQGSYLLNRLSELKTYDFIGDVRGIGLLTGIELVKNKDTKEPFPRSIHLAEKIVTKAFHKGLNMYFSIGFADKINGDAVIIAPPYNVTKTQIDEITHILNETLQEIKKEINS